MLIIIQQKSLLHKNKLRFFHRLKHKQLVVREEEERWRFAVTGSKVVHSRHVFVWREGEEELLFCDPALTQAPEDLGGILSDFDGTSGIILVTLDGELFVLVCELA